MCISLAQPFLSPEPYVGWTNNIDKRISAHNASKGAKYTRGSKWKLLYKEIFESNSDAMKREIVLKKVRKLRTQLRKKLV
jgi:Predicted endonuclease containing a URI domain